MTAITIIGSDLVGHTGGFEINLLWEASVNNAPNVAAFEQSVINAASIYTGNITNNTVINIQVGYGDVNGSAMAAGAVGNSSTTFYSALPTATLDNKLAIADAALFGSQQNALNFFNSVSEPSTVYYSQAEAKVLGITLNNPSQTDGYIGLSSSNPLYYGQGTLSSNQYDAEAAAFHEISEVLGRMTFLNNSGSLDTVLNLFDFSGGGCLGAILFGPLGLLCGQSGANKIQKTCLKCNKNFR